MTGEEIEAIVGGYHGDPFRILGPHAARKRGAQEKWEVRAFLPHAESAAVILDGTPTPMVKKHERGFFVATLSGQARRYRLQAKLWHGPVIEFDDPYRFWTQISDYDLYLFGEGTNYQSYHMLGAHLSEADEVSGVRFAVWAPNAHTVSVVGDFNQWDPCRHPMRRRQGGVWELFVPGIGEGVRYKYNIRSQFHGYQAQKSDPYAFAFETPPKSASIVVNLDSYAWQDAGWMEARAKANLLRSPVSVYEVHLESWLRGPQNRYLSYRELAEALIPYAKRMGYTHLELLPVMEYPYGGSWGYQAIGYFAPTARFGPPQDFMYFVDCCHRAGLGVIVDWVPAHFPKDAHGLVFFDGTALYEHADPRKGEHRDWGTLIFNFGRNEVRDFLISSALFWLKQYHIDGLRVDAVASMLYLDYSRKPGEWIPNQFGGNENLEAIDFLKRFNEQAHSVPGAITIAEESTAFPGVSRPVYLNGLGFTMKWNMGWMHDMLQYFGTDPIYRKYHHQNITFSMIYAFTENFVLPISHDEVVYGKRSLLAKMPGDEWQRFASARAFLSYMYAHPGKKLLFMGSEIGQYEEWNSNAGIRWELLEFDYHRQLQELVAALNRLYAAEPALHQVEFHWSGFEWVDFHDADHSVISFIRRSEDPAAFLLFCCNFTPEVWTGYSIGVPEEGFYEEIFNSDWKQFGGSGVANSAGLYSEAVPCHGRAFRIRATLPPLAVICFRRKL
ncbi:MAG: 1,4-alpha-glucan branching protein GlgB [Bryobacterales bacterium]|nr:1,4-alpha-glucan branching protein GlgB [Bryobacterales bacterium]